MALYKLDFRFIDFAAAMENTRNYEKGGSHRLTAEEMKVWQFIRSHGGANTHVADAFRVTVGKELPDSVDKPHGMFVTLVGSGVAETTVLCFGTDAETPGESLAEDDDVCVFDPTGSIYSAPQLGECNYIDSGDAENWRVATEDEMRAFMKAAGLPTPPRKRSRTKHTKPGAAKSGNRELDV